MISPKFNILEDDTPTFVQEPDFESIDRALVAQGGKAECYKSIDSVIRKNNDEFLVVYVFEEVTKRKTTTGRNTARIKVEKGEILLMSWNAKE